MIVIWLIDKCSWVVSNLCYSLLTVSFLFLLFSHLKKAEIERFVNNPVGAIHERFSVGDVVWTKMLGYPWWPCMVTTDPQFNKHTKQNGGLAVPLSFSVIFFNALNLKRMSAVKTNCFYIP